MSLLLRCASTALLLVACFPHLHEPGPPESEPPPAPEAGVTTTSSQTTFAIDSVVLDGPDAGWRSLGFDLDGKTTNPTSTDACTLLEGAPLDEQTDGIAGRDNSFGANIAPVFAGLGGPICYPSCPQPAPPVPTLTSIENPLIQRGLFTLQIRVTGLSDDPTQTATGLAVDVFTSSALNRTPAFDTTTDWPVRAESLNDRSTLASGARAHFGSAYVTGGTLVAGTNENVTVELFVNQGGSPLTFIVNDAIITFDHASPNAATNGVIAGVLDPVDAVAAFRAWLATVSHATASPWASAFTRRASRTPRKSHRSRLHRPIRATDTIDA